MLLRSLLLVLCLSQAHAADGTLAERIGTLLIKSRNPGTMTVGRQDPAALIKDYQALREELLDRRNALTRDLGTSARQAQDPAQALQEKLLGVVSYFDQLSTLSRIHVYLSRFRDLGVSPARDERLQLEVSLSTLSELSGYELVQDYQASGAIAQFLMDQNQPLVVDSDSVRALPAEPSGDSRLRLRVGDAFLQGQEMQARSNFPGEKETIEIAKAILAQFLYKQWGENNLLRREPEASPPALPAGFVTVFGSAQHFARAFESSSQMEAEQALRATLLEHAQAFLQKQGASDVQLGAFASLIANHPLPLASLGAERLERALARTLGDAGFSSVSHKDLERYVRDSRGEASSKGRDLQRRQRISALISASKRIKSTLDPSDRSEGVDLKILIKVLKADLASLGVRGATSDMLDKLGDAPSYAEACQGYQILRNFLRQRAVKADLDALEKAGPLLGLAEQREKAPSIGELPVSEAVRESYRLNYEGEHLSNMLLSTPVGTGERMPLWKVLASLDEVKEYGQAEVWVDSGIQQLQRNIVRQLDSIAGVQSMAELAKVAGNSALVRKTLKSSYPTLNSYEAQLTDRLLDGLQTYEKISGLKEAYLLPMKYMLPLFAVELVTQVLRPTRPLVLLVDRFKTNFMPHVAGYMLASLPLIFTDIGWQGWQKYEALQAQGQREELSYTSSTDVGIFTYFELMDAEAANDAASSALMVSGVTQALFLGSPLFARQAKRLYLFATDRRRAAWFAKLGFEPGRYVWDEAAIQAQATARMAAEPSARSAVKKAADGLLKALKKERAQIARARRDLSKQLRALGVAETEAKPFDVEKLDALFKAKELAYQKGEVSFADYRSAETAKRQIVRYMLDAWEFAQPGLVARLVGKVRKKPVQAAGVREQLIDQVYGFKAATPGAAGSAKARAKNAFKGDAYEVLGIPKNADAATIRRAYRKKMLKYHPDRNQGDAEAAEKFKEAQAAYQSLGSPQ